MFGRSIYPLSFVWSALLTILFSLLVNAVMYRKLKAISMVVKATQAAGAKPCTAGALHRTFRPGQACPGLFMPGLRPGGGNFFLTFGRTEVIIKKV